MLFFVSTSSLCMPQRAAKRVQCLRRVGLDDNIRLHWLVAESKLLRSGSEAFRAISIALILTVADAMLSQVVFAEATLIDGLGGAAGFGPAGNCLQPNDDNYSGAISLAPVFPQGLRFFQATPHTQMFVNTNGNISFGAGQSQYTPQAFPASSNPMIAPFWADLDNRYTGGTCSSAATCQNPTENGVWWYLEPPSSTNAGRVVVTWDRVMYYHACTIPAVERNKRVSLQLILTPAPLTTTCASGQDFDVEFRYNRCEWETGSATTSGGVNGFGGIPAQAGFDAGNQRDFVEIQGSRMNGIARRLCTTSNVGESGIWRFQIRGGEVQCQGGGVACAVEGQLGACADGVTRCVGSGTACRQVVTASDERCDGVDSDCDGMVDENTAHTLCDTGLVCERGRCVAPCSEGFCSGGRTCSASGSCVDSECVNVECLAGQVCSHGLCGNACDGARCPDGQSCRGGRCVDLCASMNCDGCGICFEGACVGRCEQSGCPTGQACAANGHCVVEACAAVTCDAGQVCRAGICTNACDSVVCPYGNECREGRCMEVSTTGENPIDAGSNGREDATVITSDASRVDSGTGTADATTGRPLSRGGSKCNCAVMASRDFSALAWCASAWVVALFCARFTRKVRSRRQ